MAGILAWGWNGTIWVPLKVDNAGHLQVDVITAGGTTSRLYGYDTANWQWLQVESAALHNLRTAIFGGGAGPVLVTTPDATHVTTDISLLASSILYAWDGTNYRRVDMAQHTATMPDTHYALCVNSVLYAWDGVNYTRLLVDAGDNLQVDVNEVRSTNTSTIAQVAVGIASTAVIAANAARIFAIFVNDSDNVIYLALGAAAVMNRGIRLNANGGSFEIGLTNLYTGAVKAISGVAASNLTVSEG